MSSPAVQKIAHYLRISDTLGTAGQPTREQFVDIKAAGYQLVVNLAMLDSPDAIPNEDALVTEQGMDYVHIPVVWDAPKVKDVERFFAVMDEHRGKRVFVHCVVNKRVSCFVFLYRVIRQRVPSEIARETLLRIWEPDAVWQDLIDKSLAQSVRLGNIFI
jgi:protein tyrosine phosphatase (PTP) superfamily phosphohydrolase (DUF442 family)